MPTVSWGSIATKVLLAAGMIVLALAILIPSYWGYEPRRRVSDALASGMELQRRIAAFHAEFQRFPSLSEEPKFRMDPGQLGWARSVVYDPAGPMIVIAMDGVPFAGKRFALLLTTEPGSGEVATTCASIDLDVKYLPAACRQTMSGDNR